MFAPADWLAASARRVPEREALRVLGRSYTYAELDREASAMASSLWKQGVREGDRVATLLPNGVTSAIIPHAALRLGATLVPLNTRLAPAEIEWQLEHCQPRLVISSADQLQIPRFARDDRGDARDDRGDARDDRGDRGDARDHEPAPDHPLAIIYTSGTTGRPRGAVLTVANFAASAKASAANLGVRDDDRWLAVLPLFHVGGLSILLRSAMQGTCAVVHERFDAAAVNHAIDHERITIVSLVAVLIQRLLDDRGERPFPPSLRAVLAGGGPVPPALLERSARAGLPVVQTYGLTEATSQVATLAPADALSRLGSAGRPLEGTEVRIHGGAEGEILVRGPTVMQGYFRDPEATRRAMADGWLHTGDVGRLDDAGYLYVLDRRDDLIVTGGENVYPAEVEGVLEAHPSVEEAAVIGAPDATWGQRVVAVVRLRPGASASVDALTAWCRERLAGYKVPRVTRIVDAPLPRTASGKLQRSLLRDFQ
ncbi:MAG TPA: o-succinylbenzoate--CoA ligase [Gemmatimonadaceae bacterium]|nr:o-succinylbenzoate--CoA ligase [Gemmatimonadaceae bacterium]